MGTQKNRLNETVLLSTHNIWIRKYSKFYAQKFCLSKPLASTGDFVTYCIHKQQRLRRAYKYTQSRQSLGFLHTQSMEVEEASVQRLDLHHHWIGQHQPSKEDFCTYAISTKISCVRPFKFHYQF